MEAKIITSPKGCCFRTYISHCNHPEGIYYCTDNNAFPKLCPLQSIILKDNKETLKDIQKENNLLVLEKEQPTATKVIECPVCKGRGLMHTEEGSSLVDCDNCNSTGKIEIGS